MKLKQKLKTNLKTYHNAGTNSACGKKILIRWQNQLFHGMQFAVHLTQRGYLIFYIKLSTDVWRVESVAVTLRPHCPPSFHQQFTAFFNSRITQKDALIGLTIDNLSCYIARWARFLSLSIPPLYLNLNACGSSDNYCSSSSAYHLFNNEIFGRSFPRQISLLH